MSVLKNMGVPSPSMYYCPDIASTRKTGRPNKDINAWLVNLKQQVVVMDMEVVLVIMATVCVDVDMDEVVAGNMDLDLDMMVVMLVMILTVTILLLLYPLMLIRHDGASRDHLVLYLKSCFVC